MPAGVADGDPQVLVALPAQEDVERSDPRRHPQRDVAAVQGPGARQDVQPDGVGVDRMRIRGFPFGDEVWQFIERHDLVFVVDQNRDAQMRTLLINEGDVDPAKLVPVLYYAGLSLSAEDIHSQVLEHFKARKLPRLTEVRS